MHNIFLYIINFIFIISIAQRVMIGYFFDAFSHGFDAIEGIDIKNYKEQILKTLDDYPNWI